MLRKFITILISLLFVFEQTGFAQIAPQIPVPAYLNGLMTPDRFRPVQLRFMKVEDAAKFEVFVDRGDAAEQSEQSLRETGAKLMKYFQIGLRLPNKNFWVNLRPDAATQIIDPLLEKTDLGKVLLAADLQLKKDLAGMTSPESKEGRQYWDKLYAKATELYGASEDMEIPTVTRPWIVPGEIILRQTQHSAYVYKATLKVMLEQDYIKDSSLYISSDARAKALNEYATKLVRELILPKLTRQVNASRRYADLRQAYYSLVLAQWYKTRFQDKRIDSNDLSGLTSTQAWDKKTYYQAYKTSFEQGEYRKEETITERGDIVVRQYVSGGLALGNVPGQLTSINGINDDLKVNLDKMTLISDVDLAVGLGTDSTVARDGGTNFFTDLMSALTEKVNGMSGDARLVADRAKDWLVNTSVNNQLSETEVKALGEVFQRISDLRLGDFTEYEQKLVAYELKRAVVEGKISSDKAAGLEDQLGSFVTGLLTAFGSRESMRMSLDTVAEVYSVIPKQTAAPVAGESYLAGILRSIDSMAARQESADARDIGIQVQRWLVNDVFSNQVPAAELQEIAGVFAGLATLELGSYTDYGSFLQEKAATLVNQKILEGKIAAVRGDAVKEAIGSLFRGLNGRFSGEYRYHDAVAEVNFYARESGMDAASRDGGTVKQGENPVFYRMEQAGARFETAVFVIRAQLGDSQSEVGRIGVEAYRRSEYAPVVQKWVDTINAALAGLTYEDARQVLQAVDTQVLQRVRQLEESNVQNELEKVIADAKSGGVTSQADIAVLIKKNSPVVTGYVKDVPIMMYKVDQVNREGYFDELPGGIREQMGVMDNADYQQSWDEGKYNNGYVVALQIDARDAANPRPDFYVMGMDSFNERYKQVGIDEVKEKNSEVFNQLMDVSVVNGRYSAKDAKLIGALKTQTVDMVKMSEAGFAVGQKAEIEAPWGGSQTKEANLDAFLVLEGKEDGSTQYYMVQDSGQGLPQGYVLLDATARDGGTGKQVIKRIADAIRGEYEQDFPGLENDPGEMKQILSNLREAARERATRVDKGPGYLYEFDHELGLARYWEKLRGTLEEALAIDAQGKRELTQAMNGRDNGTIVLQIKNAIADLIPASKAAYGDDYFPGGPASTLEEKFNQMASLSERISLLEDMLAAMRAEEAAGHPYWTNARVAQRRLLERQLKDVQKDLDSVDDLGGIDFRALPLPQMGTPGALPVMDMKALQAIAANARITDVDKAWKAIEKDIARKAVPCDKLKELVAVCCVKGSKDKLNEIAARLAQIIGLEEECAVQTSAQMQQVLQMLESAA